MRCVGGVKEKSSGGIWSCFYLMYILAVCVCVCAYDRKVINFSKC